MMSGRRNDHRLARFQRNVPIENDHGDLVPNWQMIGEQWVAVVYGRGDERRQAATERRVQAATFIALDCAMTRGVTVSDRIVHAGQAWDIVGIVPRPHKGEIDFDARRAD